MEPFRSCLVLSERQNINRFGNTAGRLHTGYYVLANINVELHVLCFHAGNMETLHSSWLFGKEAIAKSRMQC
jgi:hypothetical protein